MKVKNLIIQNKTLTPSQRKAIDSESYPMYIEAGAGTGKTEILTAKIEKLIIDMHVSLSEIIVITFTNKAISEMRERLSRRLYSVWIAGGCSDDFVRKQIDYLNMADISTIHSFCGKLIREYGLEINISPNFAVGGFKSETRKIQQDTVRKHYDYSVFRDISPYKVNEAIRLLYTLGADKGTAIDAIETEGEDASWAEVKKLLIRIYKEAYAKIEHAKKEANIITKNDMIKFAADLMQIASVARQAAARYKYIFVDETQDTNQDQYRLIYGLMAQGINVIIAGDRKQSIYKFRGADIHSFDKMVSDLSAQDKRLTLEDNFRTDGELLKRFNYIFNSTFEACDRPLNFRHQPLKAGLSEQGDKCPIRLIYSMNLISAIKECHKSIGGLDKVCYNINIGVLCRYNSELNIYAWQLRKAGIPVEVRGSRSFYKSKPIIDTFKVINALINSGGIEQSETRFTDYYTSYCRSIECDSRGSLFDLLLKDLAYNLRDNTITRFLKLLYEKTEIMKHYEREGKEQEKANLIKLIDIGRELNDEGLQPTDFLRFLEMMISSSQDEDSAELTARQASSGVVLSTIHRAKGLGFDVVIIPKIEANLNGSLRDKIIYENGRLGIDNEFLYGKQSDVAADPLYEEMRGDIAAEQMAEELRVMYVAMTRAKHALLLGTEKPKRTIEYIMSKDANVVSFYKWLYERDGGKLLEEITEQ